MIHGIDVSSYQSSTFSTAGLDFCFIKATESTNYVNPKQAAQAQHARNAGLIVGFYHFVRPGDMKRQAAHFVEKAASLEGDILWLDWEDAGVSSTQKDAFLAEVKRLRPGHRVGLYCSTSFWKSRETGSNAADALWIAEYDTGAGKPQITAPWTFHQYTDTPIDTSVGNFKDRAALRAWATKTTSTSTQEDDVALTTDDINKIAAATANKLIAGGGVLENSDLERLLGYDGVPAARPPYNNSDYFKADGKTVNNDKWTLGYTLQTTVEGTRQSVNLLQQLGAKIDAQGIAITELSKALASRDGEIDVDSLVARIEQAIESLDVRITTSPNPSPQES